MKLYFFSQRDCLPAMRLSLLAAAFLVVTSSPNRSAAAGPCVEFDVASVVACRDVTTEEFAKAHPEEKLLRASFHLSSLIRQGRESDLIQFFYRIESPTGSLRIVDHLPRTELTSPVVGSIAVEKKDESTHRIGALIGGQYPPFSQAEINAQAGSTRGTNIRYKMLPRMELLAASGTLNRQRGVYFKLKPSPQTSLEGARQFICVLRVPKSWRGDCVHVDCQATGYVRRGWRLLEGQSSCGQAAFLVGLFVAGDEPARQAVSHRVSCDESLARAINQHAEAACREFYRSSVPGYARLQWLISPPSRSALKFHLLEQHAQGRLQNDLPSDLRDSLADCAASQEAVDVLNCQRR